MLEKFSPGAGFVEAMATVRPETLSEDSVGPVCFVFQWWRWAGGAGERERERECVFHEKLLWATSMFCHDGFLKTTYWI